MTTATEAWAASAPYAKAISDPALPLILHTDAGEQLILDAGRFTAEPDAVDRAVLDRCQGPTLDLGCGPGRLVAELARRGVPALGVDVAPAAVLLGRAAGAAVLRRSVFDRLPGTGRWPHALLMDGNIGIGGDPVALLERMRVLLRPRHGELVVETELDDVFRTYRVSFGSRNTPTTGTASATPAATSVKATAMTAAAAAAARPTAGATATRTTAATTTAFPAAMTTDAPTPEFGWTRIGTEALTALADALGFAVRERWTSGGRRFVALTCPA